jgi:hypothetical protein
MADLNCIAEEQPLEFKGEDGSFNPPECDLSIKGTDLSHTISDVRRRWPMWVYEKNYQHLVQMLTFLRDGREVKQGIPIRKNGLEVVVLEKSKYTHLIQLQQIPVDPDSLPTALALQVRLYHDAQLAEVSSYQEFYRLRARYEYPNSNMFYRDEKEQSNYLLYDWLCALMTTQFNIDDEQALTKT